MIYKNKPQWYIRVQQITTIQKKRNSKSPIGVNKPIKRSVSSGKSTVHRSFCRVHRLKVFSLSVLSVFYCDHYMEKIEVAVWTLKGIKGKAQRRSEFMWEDLFRSILKRICIYNIVGWTLSALYICWKLIRTEMTLIYNLFMNISVSDKVTVSSLFVCRRFLRILQLIIAWCRPQPSTPASPFLLAVCVEQCHPRDFYLWPNKRRLVALFVALPLALFCVPQFYLPIY